MIRVLATGALVSVLTAVGFGLTGKLSSWSGLERLAGSAQPTQSAAAAAHRMPALVARVIDGDTLRVSTADRTDTVRAIGIDTPEIHKPGVGVECGARAATNNARRLLPAGRQIVLTTDPTQDQRDHYGRLLAYVDTAGTSLQERQLARGLAEVYVFRRKFQRYEAFRRAAEVARRGGRGVFGACGGDFHSLQETN